MRAGAFGRMGYSGDLTKAQFTKSYLFGQWRYLMHVMIVSLSGRKAGFDVMGSRLQSGMISLVYNKPFSFSQYFFDNMHQQINATGRERFLLYPRFVMMIINRLIPNIPALPHVVQISHVDRRIFADCMSHSKRRPDAERPRPTDLFGFLVDVEYVAPANDGWEDEVQARNEQQRAVVDDILTQLEQQNNQGSDPIDHNGVESVLHSVLHQEGEVGVNESADDDFFRDIENYIGEEDDDAPPNQGEGADQGQGSQTIDDDSDHDDNDDGSQRPQVKRRRLVADLPETLLRQPRRLRRTHISITQNTPSTSTTPTQPTISITTTPITQSSNTSRL